jgi:antitoxin component of RelBE/YafQ-DinJ toxin-antitoxin module
VKAEYIELRCEPSEKDAFRAAAEAGGLPLSGWIRLTLRRAAKRELEAIDKPVAFLDRL